MPKELTHLIISAEALQKVGGKSPEAAATLSGNIDLFMLGSLICDTAYYHIPLFNKKKGLQCISQAIHTNRGDIDREFIIRLAASLYQCREDGHFAFFCGVLSHHMADRAFHPLVVYLTGDYHAINIKERHFAEARHRFLEGLIDLNLSGSSNQEPELKKGGRADIKREKRDLYPLLLSFVSAALPQLEDKRAGEMAMTLFKLSGLQLSLLRLYNNRSFRWTVLTINRLFRFSLSGYAAMLYPAVKSSKVPLLEDEIDYLDPFNGDRHKESIIKIKERAVTALSTAIADLFHTRGDLSGAIAPYFQTYLEKTGRPEFTATSEIDKALKEFLGIKA